MTDSTYLNQDGIAKIVHDPCFAITGNTQRYAIHIFLNSSWDPIRLPICFPDRVAAETHLATVYDQVKEVKEKYFDALVENFRVLPRNFSNCH